MTLIEIIYEFIVKYSGLDKTRAYNVGQTIIGSTEEKRKENEIIENKLKLGEDLNESEKNYVQGWKYNFYKKYFQSDRDPLILTGILIVMSFLNYGSEKEEKEIEKLGLQRDMQDTVDN